MRAPTIGNKLQLVVNQMYSEDAAAIAAGQPVMLLGNGTDDGIAVVLPSTTNSGIFAGIACYNASQYAPLDCQVSGMFVNARITLATRAASTAGWASFGAIAVGDVLTIETVGNNFVRSGASSQGNFLAQAMQTFASATTQASSYTFTYTYPGQQVNPLMGSTVSTGTVQTSVSALYITAKVFVRAM